LANSLFSTKDWIRGFLTVLVVTAAALTVYFTTIAGIKTDVAVIKVQQTHMTNSLCDIKVDIEKINENIKDHMLAEADRDLNIFAADMTPIGTPSTFNCRYKIEDKE